MNESQKNIETCLPEDILAEVAGVPQDAHFRSLVDEALDPLKQQAATQAGWDDYKEVVQSHQPYTFTSSVRQMKSNLLLLLRRLWRFPFGTGTIRSLADMWQHYITRLQGNATYGIPSRLDQLTDLPSAPLLVSDRKISGVPEAPDGISLVQLLNDTSAITELTDNTSGWTLSKDPLATFPSVTKMQLGCKYMTLTKLGNENTEDLQLNEIEELYVRDTYGTASRRSLLLFQNEVLYLPKLKKLVGTTAWSGAGFVQDNNYVKKIIMPTLNYFMHGRLTGMISYCANLEEVDLGDTKALTPNSAYGEVTALFEECPKLILVKLGEGFNTSVSLASWNPDLTDSDVLALFLSNFRDYIALRLTDNGAGKTLTLSQAVRNAIHAAESTYGIENIIITQKGWTISPAPN